MCSRCRDAGCTTVRRAVAFNGRGKAAERGRSVSLAARRRTDFVPSPPQKGEITGCHADGQFLQHGIQPGPRLHSAQLRTRDDTQQSGGSVILRQRCMSQQTWSRQAFLDRLRWFWCEDDMFFARAARITKSLAQDKLENMSLNPSLLTRRNNVCDWIRRWSLGTSRT